MLNIWIATIGEQLPLSSSIRKERASVLVDKLVSRGHNVIWWTSAFNHYKKDWFFPDEKEREIRPNFLIKPLKGIGYKKNISLSRFIDHRVIAWKFKRLVPKKQKPDIIVVSMPPHDLAYQTVVYGKGVIAGNMIERALRAS